MRLVHRYVDDDGRLIRNRKKIVVKYLRGWFAIDFLTILPYDSAKYFVPGDISILRLIRLLRLFKLLRIVRASRIFKRWESKLGLQHTTMMTFKLCITLFIFNHWLACCWGLLAYLQTETTLTWQSAWLDVRGDHASTTGTDCKDHEVVNGAYRNDCYRHLDVYSACLYW